MPASRSDEYEAVGDPDAPYEPTKRDIRRQHESERRDEAQRRRHYHRITAGEPVGGYIWHTHDEDDPDHRHPPEQMVPERPDGGYLEETGPSLGTTLPPSLVASTRRGYEELLSLPPTPDHQLMRWRLRLFCSHLVELAAHTDWKTPQQAFGRSIKCPECGLDPATIIAARPLGLKGKPPKPPRPLRPRPAKVRQIQEQLAKAEAEVARLKSELRAEQHRAQ